MKWKTLLILLVLFVTAGVTRSIAQIFWSNQRPAGITDDIWCVTNGNGVFAAVTSQGKVLTSNDGLTWSSQTVAQGTWLVSIAYGDDKWVAVGAGGTILVSADLKTWVNATAVTTNKLNGVLFTASPDTTSSIGGGVFIAVGDNGTILTSSDALNWSIQPSGISGFLHGIAFSYDALYTGGRILVSGQDGVILLGSNALQPAFRPSEFPSGTTQNLEALVMAPISGAEVVAAGGNGTLISTADGIFLFSAWNNGTLDPSSTATFRGLTSDLLT